jgi:MoxR-like ATPase
MAMLDKAIIADAIGAWASNDPAWISVMPKAGYARRPRGAGAPDIAEPDYDAAVPVAAFVPMVASAVGDRVTIGDILIRPNGQPYVARRVLDKLSDVQWLRDLLVNDMPCMLYGPPGTGKTALIEVAYDGKAYTVMGSDDTERADFEGSYVQTADGAFVWVDGPLIRAMEEGVPLFVDEIGLISPKVLSLLYAAMDGRQEIRITANPERGIVKAQPGFMVVAATNPHAPGVRLSEALLSRFICQAEMNTDWDVARRLGLADNVAAAMENLDKKRVAGEIAGSPQMREALAYIKTSAVFGQDLALANLVAASQENDRDVIADVLSRALGAKVEALALD